MKRSVSALLVLALLFSLLASNVFGGSLDDKGKFDINLSSYPAHNYYTDNPKWAFKKMPGMGEINTARYSFLTEPVQAITKTELGRTGLYIRIDDDKEGSATKGFTIRQIDSEKISLSPGINASIGAVAGVPQATDLVKDIYQSYWWIINNVVTKKEGNTVTVDPKYEGYVTYVLEPNPNPLEPPIKIPYISWDFLKGMSAFIHQESPSKNYFYWQGKYTGGPDTYEVIYRGITYQDGTGRENFHLNANTGFKKTGTADGGIEKGTVQLEFLAQLQYKDVHILHGNPTYWFNHYSNVGISEYSLSASKTMLSGDKKKSDSVVGNLDILEQNDALTLYLFSSINSSKQYFPDMAYYNAHLDEFTKERRNPAIYGATEVLYMLFTASYMPGSSGGNPDTIDQIRIRDVKMQEGKIIPTSSVSGTPFINATVPPGSQYVLVVPILNPYRLYEDILNDKTGALKNAFIQKLKGGDANSGTKKIMQQMKSDYTAKGMRFLFPDEEGYGNILAQYLYNQIIGHIKTDYDQKKNAKQLDGWHTQNAGNGRVKILYGDRLFPSNTGVQKQIIQSTRKGIEDVVIRKKDPLKVFNPSSGYEKQVKDLYDKNTSAQDIVDAYFKGDWRNVLVLPFKVKQPDALTVKITDTGISPKVSDALAGAGKNEYESLNLADPSYALPGKIYTAKYSITNNSDQPVTSFALRYYVVSTKPDDTGRPKIYEGKPLGVFYGTEYTFDSYEGKPTAKADVPPYGTSSFESMHLSVPADPYIALKIENNGTWPMNISGTRHLGFIEPGETVEGTFLWKMPDGEKNPSKDPVLLYITAAMKLNSGEQMRGTGAGEINNHFEVEELNYYPGSSKTEGAAMFFSYTPKQIMGRHVGDANVNNLRDFRTIGALLDSYVPNPKDPFDPVLYPPDKLQDKQTFLRYTTKENTSYQEYDEWVDDGYWIERQPLIIHYKRSQWIVR